MAVYTFSPNSLKKLETCDERLQDVMHEVIQTEDCIILCGFRNQEDQTRAFDKGFSKTPWPKSKHNKLPKSEAVDVLPYPLDWRDRERMIAFSQVVYAAVEKLNRSEKYKNDPIRIRWGGDFNQDGNLKNDSFVDMPHWELITT